MLKLYIKDNTDGTIHEYGTNRHDALILQEDGSLHYENIQCYTGTRFPREGYSFCLEDGSIPQWDDTFGAEPYIDIGGMRSAHGTALPAVLCGNCEFSENSMTPCAYKCKNKNAPCYGRITFADFGCTYGKKKEGNENART